MMGQDGFLWRGGTGGLKECINSLDGLGGIFQKRNKHLSKPASMLAEKLTLEWPGLYPEGTGAGGQNQQGTNAGEPVPFGSS